MRLRKVDTVPESGLGFHIPSLITYGANFLILLAILYTVGFKPILRMLNDRAETIRESLESADKVGESKDNSLWPKLAQLQRGFEQNSKTVLEQKRMRSSKEQGKTSTRRKTASSTKFEEISLI